MDMLFAQTCPVVAHEKHVTYVYVCDIQHASASFGTFFHPKHPIKGTPIN